MSDDKIVSNEEFMELLDESFNNKNFGNQQVSKGILLSGTVIKIGSDNVFLDLGLKTEGMIAKSEFDNHTLPKIGDTISAVVDNVTPSEINLSYLKAMNLNTLDQVVLAFENKLLVRALIKENTRGGFIASINNCLNAFVPISQIDVIHVKEEDTNNYLNKTFDFYVSKVTKGKQPNIVLSRKAVLFAEENKKKKEFFNDKKKGDIVTGTVTNYASFGVFVDIGGFDGLVHASDVSWRKNVKLSEVAPRGAVLKLKIKDIDQDQQKVNLSLKDLQENPWEHIEEKYSVHSIVSGEVVKILHYGAFILLDDCVEGFVHVSDISWSHRIHHPNDVLKIHSVVECKILNIEKDVQRISLGIKQIHENPWDLVETKYPLGFQMSCTIVKEYQIGSIVELEDGFSGFIAREHYSWSKQNEIHFDPGEHVETKVLSYDQENRRINLGIKQLSENPWEQEDLKAGNVVEGEIMNITDFGIFLQVTDDIIGLVPKSQAYDPTIYPSYEIAKSNFKKGDRIQALIQTINPHNNKLILSIKEIQEHMERKELEKHIVDDTKNHHSVSLGDILDSQKSP